MSPAPIMGDRQTTHLVVAIQMIDDHLQHLVWKGRNWCPAMRTHDDTLVFTTVLMSTETGGIGKLTRQWDVVLQQPEYSHYLSWLLSQATQRSRVVRSYDASSGYTHQVAGPSRERAPLKEHTPEALSRAAGKTFSGVGRTAEWQKGSARPLFGLAEPLNHRAEKRLRRIWTHWVKAHLLAPTKL